MSDQTGDLFPTPYPEQHGLATPPANPSPSRPAYRHETRHITQEPIDDVETTYVTRERYVTLDKLQKPRRVHMGVAEGDPEYLPQTKGGKDKRGAAGGEGGKPRLHYDRYLELPKRGKSIFTRRERARKRTRRLIAIVAILVVIAVVVWVFFLR